METVFTPYQSLAGGLLIGASAVLLMLTMGRIMGATGILAGIFAPVSSSDWSWRVALVGGMISAPALYALATGQMPAVNVETPTPALVFGGLLVGIGVTFGSGCTSGHGVCGMARLSRRSIFATLAFMASTAATVFVLRHVVGG